MYHCSSECGKPDLNWTICDKICARVVNVLYTMDYGLIVQGLMYHCRMENNYMMCKCIVYYGLWINDLFNQFLFLKEIVNKSTFSCVLNELVLKCQKHQI